MTEHRFWYRDHCPVCGEDGELVIAQDESGALLLVCAECGIGFRDERDVTDANKSEDMLERKLQPATEAQIIAAGWRHLCRYRVQACLPHR